MRSQVSLGVQFYWSQEEADVALHYISVSKWYTKRVSR